MDIHVAGLYPRKLPGVHTRTRSQLAWAKISLFTQYSKGLPKPAQRFFVPLHESQIVLVIDLHGGTAMDQDDFFIRYTGKTRY
jgi:hypothetical protein